MKVVLHYATMAGLRDRLAELSSEGLEVASCAEHDEESLLALIQDAEVLWHVLKPVTAAIIGRAPKLRLIQKIGVGVNTIDLEAARARGIQVCNMPGTNSRAVAEMTLGLMLAALRRIPALDRALRDGRGWDLGRDMQEQAAEVAGRCVGLVGFGAVPRLLAPVLTAMGARVLYTARAPKPEVTFAWRDLDVLLAEADIVSLHVPLTPETENMIDAAALARMKDGAVLVNTARGELVEEGALVDALQSGRLRSAGLDVFAREPVAPDDPLLQLNNVVLAPHIAWLTPETLERSLFVAVENCRRLAAGQALLHRVV